MIEISLDKYAPLINNEHIAKEIYQKIIDADPINNEILIRMEKIISIDCHNILNIFGELYDYLGADKFHENIILKFKKNKDKAQECFLGDYIAFILSERNKRREEEKNKNKKND